MNIAIEASNIRAGGGITHLAECLAALDPLACGVSEVVVYAGESTLCHLENRSWLRKVCPRAMQGGALARVWWNHFGLDKEITRKADLLLVPGGSYLGRFRPFVALAQNLLPFDEVEQRREGWSLKRLRLLLLERIQGTTFKRADGVIYMTAISRDQMERRLGVAARRSRVVHHGTSPRFFRSRPPEMANTEFVSKNPFRLLYVSILEPYKNQGVVVDAVGEMLKDGVPVGLDFVGPGSHRDQYDLRERIRRWDPSEIAMKYHGMIPYDKLSGIYKKADAFIFASSCETFGIILLEAMAGGLPVICSHRSAMPEVAGSAAVYFNPSDSNSLVSAIRLLLNNAGLRRALSFQAQRQAAKYSWERCARETFGFVRYVHDEYRRSSSGCS